LEELVTNLFKPPAPPQIIPAPAMPNPNDPANLAAQNAAIAKAMSSGRSSTTLTSAGGTVAGGGGSSVLGST
jgi:hypothetical protein